MNISMFSPGVVPPLHYGGTERVVDWLIKELTGQGHSVYLFGPRGSSVPSAKEVFYVDIPGAIININPVDIRDRIPEDTDIVHIHCASNLDYGYPVLKTVHGYPFHVKGRPFGQGSQFDEHYSFVSNAHRNVCGRRGNPYVYNGIDPEEYIYSAEKDDYFLFMGKLDWNAKGLAFALKIATEMNLRLVLAGDFMDPSFYDRELKGVLNSDIRYAGPVAGRVKAELLSGARGLLSPIRWPEPFGLVVTEALASGTPVLTTFEGAMPEIMVQGVTGFMCNTVGDFKEGVKSIDKIDPGRCREHVKKYFTAEKMSRNYLQLYEQIIKQHKIRKRGYTLPSVNVVVADARNGKPSLRVKSEDGSLKTIHSMYDPEAEAVIAVNTFEFNGDGVLVVLGLGLGYHLSELKKRYPDAEIVVVEAIQEIYEMARAHVHAGDDGIVFLVGLSHDEVIKRITVRLVEKGIPPLSLYVLTPAASAFPGYYRPLIESLEHTMSEKVSRKIEDSTQLMKKMLDRLKYESISSKMSSMAGNLCFEMGMYEHAKYFYERTIAIDTGDYYSFRDLVQGTELQDMKEYWNDLANDNPMRHIATDDWESEEVFHKCGERDVENLLNHLNNYHFTHKKNRMLEIGCGIGRMLKPFAMRYPDWEIYGVDVSEDMVRKGRERLGEFVNVRMHGTNGKDLSIFEDRSFDFIYSYVVLQHIPRKFVHNYFREVSRILDEKGCFVFQMPMRTQEAKPPEPPDSDFRTVRYYTLDEVHSLCGEKGLKIVHTSRCSEDSLWFTAGRKEHQQQ